MTLVPRLIAAPSETSRLLGSTFAIQSPLQDLANIGKSRDSLIFLLDVETITSKLNQSNFY
jgi:hypothetical protein